MGRQKTSKYQKSSVASPQSNSVAIAAAAAVSIKEDQEEDNLIHSKNFADLGNAVKQAKANLQWSTVVVKDSTQTTTTTATATTAQGNSRRKSPRNASSSSTKVETEAACKIACALSLFLNGVDRGKSMIMRSQPSTKMLMGDDVSRVVKEAHDILNRWRKNLSIGTELEFLDTVTCTIQKTVVVQNLNGSKNPSSKIVRFNPISNTMETYQLKKEDVAIKFDKMQHWLCLGGNNTTTDPIHEHHHHHAHLVDIGTVPMGSFLNLCKAWNHTNTWNNVLSPGRLLHRKDHVQKDHEKTTAYNNDNNGHKKMANGTKIAYGGGDQVARKLMSTSPTATTATAKLSCNQVTHIMQRKRGADSVGQTKTVERKRSRKTTVAELTTCKADSTITTAAADVVLYPKTMNFLADTIVKIKVSPSGITRQRVTNSKLKKQQIVEEDFSPTCKTDTTTTTAADVVLHLEPTFSSTTNNEEKQQHSFVLASSSTITAKGQRNSKPTMQKSQKSITSVDFSWICAQCHEAECQLFKGNTSTSESNTDDDAVVDLDFLVICDGPCNRAFHIPCAANEDTTTFSFDQEWKCKDCMSLQHACCLCGEYGQDDTDVWCCTRKDCGLFYHESCLAMGAFFPEVKIKVLTDNDNNNNNNIEDDDNIDSEEIEFSGGGVATATAATSKTVKFSCPAHHCWTCDDGNPFGPKPGSLFRCLYCPNAYHATCIPPTAKFHELALLCHDHSRTHKLPDLDIETSVQAELEQEAQVKIDKFKDKQKKKDGTTEQKLLQEQRRQQKEIESIPFFGTLNIKKVKKTEVPFRLPVDFRDEVYAKPPSYHHIQSLQYDKVFRPKQREPSGESCQCHLVYSSTTCGQHCLNRITYQECVGKLNTLVGEKHRYWNCEIGIDCGNRLLGRKLSARCKVKRQVGKGFGLIAVEGVKRGSLVQEYVGDVINVDIKKQRLAEWAKENPNDPNFYIMQLEPGWFIDARERGNLSRFINHSCDPNCELVPKNVAGYMRMAIMAMKDIEPGHFLSYDYQFDTNQAERFACRCGARNCRGSLMSNYGVNKGNNNEKEKKTKKQLLTEAKARADRDEKFIEDLHGNKARRLNLVGSIVPGADHKDVSQTVLNGPQLKYHHCSTVFLWRNVTACSDWNRRFERRSLQRQGSWPKPKILDPGPPRNSLSQIKDSNDEMNGIFK